MTVNTVHAFNTADWELDHSFLVQLQNPGETYTAACPFYLIDHPEGVVVVDTGLSHDMLDDPAAYGQFGEAFMEDFLPFIEWDVDMHPRSHLEEAGYDPSEIDYVVLSHLHSDHAGQIDTFPDAEFIVQKRELQYAWWPDPVQKLFYLSGDFTLLRSNDYDVTVIESEYDVFGDGSVVTVPTPGHTPGHQSVRVERDEGTLILGIDIAHRKPGYEQEFLASFTWDLETAIASVHKVKALARQTDATVRVLHDRDDFTALAD